MWARASHETLCREAQKVRSPPVASSVRAVRRGASQVPRPVVAATLVFGLLLALWSVALPLGDAPDEPAHADLVFHLATGAPYPRHDGRKLGLAVQRLCRDTAAAIRACPGEDEVVTSTNIRPHTAANAPPRGSRRDFNQDGGDDEVGSFNQMLQHPPLYYWAMSGIVRAERFVLPGKGLPPLDREFALLRLANVLLVVPLPLMGWWACRRLGLAGEIGIVASLVPFAVPQLLHIGSTLNNDNLLTLLAATLTVLLAGVVRGDLSLRTAGGVGVVTGLALLTKAFAVVLPLVVAAAYVVAWYRWRTRLRKAVAGLTTAALLSVAVGGWWYIRNVLRGDGLSPTTENGRLTSRYRPPGFHTDLPLWLRRFGSLFTERFWGWFGWFTVRISIAVIIGATVVLFGAMAAGVASVRSAPRAHLAKDEAQGVAQPIGRVDVGVLLLPATLFGAFVVARSWSLYGRTSLFSFIQGRYVFGGVVGIAVVAAVGISRLTGRWAAIATFGWAVVMQSEGLRRVLSGYWGARGSGPLDQVRALVAWNAWPGQLLVVGAIALVATTGWLAIEVALTSRRAPVARPPTSDPPMGTPGAEAGQATLPEIAVAQAAQ